MYGAFRKQSAIPERPPLLQLKLYSPTQSIFQRTIFKCEPPIITNCTDSPYASGPFPLCKLCYSKQSLIKDGNSNIPWIEPFSCLPLSTKTMLNHCSSRLFVTVRQQCTQRAPCDKLLKSIKCDPHCKISSLARSPFPQHQCMFNPPSLLGLCLLSNNK